VFSGVPLVPWLVPFWRSTTMHRESVVFLKEEGGPTEASLLFPPEAILTVSTASGVETFREGLDYAFDRARPRIARLSGSRMPEIRRNDVAAEGAPLHHSLVDVSYTHAEDLGAWRPATSPGTLPRIARRLQRGEPLTICVTGDSIAEGYDSSGFHGVPPHQPGFARLVASGLEQEFGGAVDLRNLAVAGSTAADALWDALRVAIAAPDLVIVAFGMNDASYADAAEFSTNIATLLQRIRDAAPQVEFLLVSPMLPTAECSWVAHTRFEEYQASLARLTGEGVALADVTAIWTGMIARKNPQDLSGNGLNHPNDFGHRVYAQVILDQLATVAR
jgi:lysophospholipase L1-like esterase